MTTSALPSPCPDDCLACSLAPRSCDGTTEPIDRWLARRGVHADPVLRYLRTRGGYCACEVVGVLDGDRTVLDDVVLSCGR